MRFPFQLEGIRSLSSFLPEAKQQRIEDRPRELDVVQGVVKTRPVDMHPKVPGHGPEPEVGEQRALRHHCCLPPDDQPVILLQGPTPSPSPPQSSF